MGRDFIQQNQASRERLRQLVGRLTAHDFEQPIGNGWTISTLLCHLAFWDQRVLYLLKEWQAGRFEAARFSLQQINGINEAVKAVARAVVGSAAGRLAVESASAVDAEVEGISDALAEQIVNSGFERMLNRSLHRLEHLQPMEEALESVNLAK